MDSTRNLVKIIEIIQSCGIEINTHTKARGNKGFFRKNRIDISKNSDGKISTLLHEFAHYIHFQLDKNCKDYSVLFDSNDKIYYNEMLRVTDFVDENSRCEKLNTLKIKIKLQIKEQENIIKKDYPSFMRSKKFEEFDKYIKRSDAKHLLKYDKVKIMPVFWGTPKVYTIENIENDFPKMSKSFCAYIRLKSLQRKQTKISARMNKYKKYYSSPSELFARFIEGIYLDFQLTKQLAPNTCKRFFELLNKGYYGKLKNIIEILHENTLRV